MSGRLLRRPGLPAKLKRYHEASTLVTLGLIAAHGGVLLLDGYLRPSLAGVTLPFALGYRPFWTGLGVIGGWLALILAGSFYVRRWIGVKTWRWLHRWTLAVYVLALAHVIGAGTDGRSPWMLALLAVLVAPNVFALAYRMLPAAPRPRSNPLAECTPAASGSGVWLIHTVIRSRCGVRSSGRLPCPQELGRDAGRPPGARRLRVRTGPRLPRARPRAGTRGRRHLASS